MPELMHGVQEFILIDEAQKIRVCRTHDLQLPLHWRIAPGVYSRFRRHGRLLSTGNALYKRQCKPPTNIIVVD